MSLSLFSLVFFIMVSSCNNSDDNVSLPINNVPLASGIQYSETATNELTVYDAVITALNGNTDIAIVAEVNHSSNAQSVGMDLDFTRTILFGNPNLGTPIMQVNMHAGLDLPQKIEVYKDSDGQTVALFNSTTYLANRHNVGAVTTLPMIQTALTNLVTNATGTSIQTVNDATTLGEGIIVVDSNNDMETTYNNIISTLESLEPVSIIAELDHQANAMSVGLELNPSKLIVFGNPTLGTPLMQTSRSTAIDLPQKMLVYQTDEGDVKIIYNDPSYIAQRHQISGNAETLNMIAMALQNIADSGAN
ncbi:MAG: DUF302 domain-containing protein [Aquaticitalea sp.]